MQYFGFLLLACAAMATEVTFDERAIVIDGQR